MFKTLAGNRQYRASKFNYQLPAYLSTQRQIKQLSLFLIKELSKDRKLMFSITNVKYESGAC